MLWTSCAELAAMSDTLYFSSPPDVRRYQKPVDLSAQCFAHLAATNIGNRMEREAVKELVVIQKVFPYAVHNEV